MKKNGVFVNVMALIGALMMLTIVASVGAGAVSTKSAAVAVKRAPMTELTEEQVEALVQNYFDTSETRNPTAYANNFAPNGTLEDPVGTPVIQGTANITAAFGGIVAPFKEVKFKVQEIVVGGHEAAVNWKLHLKRTDGKKIQIDGMGIFTFNAQGKLEAVREFWDLQAFLAQMQN